TGSDYAGDFEYDPRTGRVYHGNSGSSSREIHVYRVAGDAFVNVEATGTYGTANQDGGGSVVLSVDGSRLYYGRLQVEALDVKHTLRTFPEAILAASRDLAFGQRNYYDAKTGATLGSLNFPSPAYTVSPDGMTLWVFDGATTTLHRYDLEGDK